jgi:hypothetical protein
VANRIKQPLACCVLLATTTPQRVNRNAKRVQRGSIRGEKARCGAAYAVKAHFPTRSIRCAVVNRALWASMPSLPEIRHVFSALQGNLLTKQRKKIARCARQVRHNQNLAWRSVRRVILAAIRGKPARLTAIRALAANSQHKQGNHRAANVKWGNMWYNV